LENDALKCSFITIEHNEVSGCAIWNQYLCHGISLWKAHSAGLGADPSGFNCVIRRNMSYGNENKVGPWGGPVAKATDGNGIILDCNNDNGYPHATLVEGNLVFNNGDRGIHVLKSDNVTVRYNTCWHNNRCHLDGTWKQGELESDGSARFRAEDNIVVGNTNAWSAALALHSFGPTLPMVLKNNLLFGAREVGQQVALTETGTLRADPRFVDPSADPAAADFRLQAGSPAIRAGDATPTPSPDLAGIPRPQGPANDLGAYKFTPPSRLSSPAQHRPREP
jgi:parallel beta-helix repeat protein